MEKDQNLSQDKISQSSADLIDALKHSFEFWHKNYIDAPLNYPLIWKKALDSNSEISKRIEKTWRSTIKQGTEIQIEQFLECWSQAIRKSNFELAKKPIQEWQTFWENTTAEQFKMYSEVLKVLEKYWKNEQRKSIE
ncbi:MAG: hypothetical protein OEM28_10635 [Nitrosopumilus sp.]|nr:hypothetical protein [Nitrosopumilus sp.]MDH3488394.1 hypothetical protein [Nitrosopumilus sp.]